MDPIVCMMKRHDPDFQQAVVGWANTDSEHDSP